MKGINTPQGKPGKVEAKPPFPPQGARCGSLRCLGVAMGTTALCIAALFIPIAYAPQITPMPQATSATIRLVTQPEPIVLPEPIVRPEPIGGYYPLESTTVGPTFDSTLLAKRIIYPSLAKRQGKEGVVVLRLFISSSGDVEDIWIVDDPGYGFGEAAQAAFQGMQVAPASIEGKPIAVTLLFPVRFTLRN